MVNDCLSCIKAVRSRADALAVVDGFSRFQQNFTRLEPERAPVPLNGLKLPRLGAV